MSATTCSHTTFHVRLQVTAFATVVAHRSQWRWAHHAVKLRLVRVEVLLTETSQEFY